MRYNYINYWNPKKSGQLKSQESREFNWMYTIDEILITGIVISVTS